MDYIEAIALQTSMLLWILYCWLSGDVFTYLYLSMSSTQRRKSTQCKEHAYILTYLGNNDPSVHA